MKGKCSEGHMIIGVFQLVPTVQDCESFSRDKNGDIVVTLSGKSHSLDDDFGNSLARGQDGKLLYCCNGQCGPMSESEVTWLE